MTDPVLPDIAGLTAADAASLDAQVAQKRALIEQSINPASTAKLQAEVGCLEA